MLEYFRDPGEIERISFRRIREQTDLGRFDADEAQVAMRLVHTCGDPEIVHELALSPGAVGAGVTALRAGVPLLCDVEMVRHGIATRHLNGPVLCFLNAAATAVQARAHGQTRSMAAVERWPEHLEGAIAVIGNAPTALFRLLELLLAGAPRPALIIGTPVGFVGAAESKAALLELAAGLEVSYVAVRGQRGGSALAAASINAMARLARGLRV